MGKVCEVVEDAGCAVPPCEPGGECPDVQCDNVQEYRACVTPPPQACETDSECGAGLVCVTVTYDECDGGAAPMPCSSEEGCPEPSIDPMPGGDCRTVSEGYCVPPYLAPCETDGDCGAGFECAMTATSCSCSGGVPGSPGVGTDPEPYPGDDSAGESDGGSDEGGGHDREADDCRCDEVELDEGYCRLLEVPCESDGDCQNGFTCQAGAMAPDVGVCSYDAETGVEECYDAPSDSSSQRYCAPADFGNWGYPRPGGPGIPSNDEGEYTGTPGSAHGPGDSDDSGNAPPRASDGGERGERASGCQAVPSQGSAPATLHVVLGLVAFGWLRRRRS